MKILKAHRETIVAAIHDALKRSNFVYIYQVEQLYRKKGIGKDPAKRARWDVFYAAKVGEHSLNRWASDHLAYANQDHIDSVLRSIK